jgi:adenylate kinase
MKLVFLGPPGAGKGTQADNIAKWYKIPKISTGDILRDALHSQTELGLKAKHYMQKGVLVPDDIVNQLVQERLKQDDCKNGFILDGYPRNIQQAKALEKFADVNFVIYIDVSYQILIARLTGRRTCRKCSTIYHISTNPPKKSGVCDICGSALYQRIDDTEETVKKRLETYKVETQPLIEYYKNLKKLHTIDGSGTIEIVYERIVDCIQRIKCCEK